MNVLVSFTTFLIISVQVTSGGICIDELGLSADNGCCTGPYCCLSGLSSCCCEQYCYSFGDCCDDVKEIGCEPTLSQMQANPELCIYTCTKNGHEFEDCCEGNSSECSTPCCSCDYECHSRGDCCNDIHTICDITTETPTQPPIVCKEETDSIYNLNWPDTMANVTASSGCPDNKQGTSSRLCNSTGIWQEINITDCKTVFEDLLDKQKQNGGITEQVIANLSQILQTDTNVDENDIITINEIIETTLDTLLSNLNSNSTTEPPVVTDYLSIYNVLLEEEKVPVWEVLNNEQGKTESEKLLEKMEQYSNYVARVYLFRNYSNNDSFVRENIELNCEVYNVNNVTYGEEHNITFNSENGSLIHASVPFDKLSENEYDQLAITTFITRNIAKILPPLSDVPGVAVPATNTISVQIVTSNMTIVAATFNFTTEIFPNATNPQCAFYALNTSLGGWSYDGITILESSRSGSISDSNITYNIICSVDHLTTFVVLVDTHGVLDQIPEDELLALEILSYIGLGVSCVSLILTIIVLATLGKQLIKQVQYFVHLNLAIALLLGYILFIFGVNSKLIGGTSDVACAIIAGLLHYLFLAAFSWMMCEGIMLFLLLVVVFSQISKKWYIFLAIGWGLPVIPVAITAGVVPKAYGIPEEYCWIDYSYQNALWSFLCPMIVILIANIIFLLFSIRAVVFYNRRKEKYQGKKRIGLTVFKKSIVGIVALIPLLGITWLIGLFGITAATSVFAWIFVLGSTFQGLFILLFNIMRNDKIKSTAFKFFCPTLEKKMSEKQRRSSISQKRKSAQFMTYPSAAEIEMA